MSKKHKKFDLTDLVHDGFLKEGETLQFVSDPAKSGIIFKQPNGEFKLQIGSGKQLEIVTVHALAQRYLGQDPPNHASYWFKNKAGKTLYELWQAAASDDGFAQAA